MPIKKSLMAFLVTLLGFGTSTARPAWENDPIESVVGIHVLTDYGSQHRHLGKNLNASHALSELRKLPWTKQFMQFVVVTKPGVSMEVGGSLNGVDGLSAVYRNRHDAVEAVTKVAPKSVKEMEYILGSFLNDDGKWRSLFAF
jgi:hypothetical protein